MKPVSERLGLEQAAQNRTLLAFELDVVSQKVQRFGWGDMAKAMKDRLTEDWVSVLGEFPLAEVKRAIGDCLEADPKKCPTEQAVKVAIQKRRAAAMQRVSKPEPPEPKPEKVSPEAAQRIVEEAGFKVKRP